MDLSKIKALIDFVGRSNITELTVTERKITVRIFRTPGVVASAPSAQAPEKSATGPVEFNRDVSANAKSLTAIVKAPLFGILHRAPAPGLEPFVKAGDAVQEGQTLFVVEAMKVFNKIAAPHSGYILSLTEIDGGEVETGDVLAEISQ
jgi:acetyl-CoA carboxylase biotin carboxyl carrier protein